MAGKYFIFSFVLGVLCFGQNRFCEALQFRLSSSKELLLSISKWKGIFNDLCESAIKLSRRPLDISDKVIDFEVVNEATLYIGSKYKLLVCFIYEQIPT